MGNFKHDLERGEIGEQVVLKYLKSLSYIDYVEDVRQNKVFQKYDIDFIAFIEDDWVSIEVKTDSMAHRTGNIAYEVYSSKTYKTKGCFEKTKATFIYYYLSETKELYSIRVKALRRHIEKRYKSHRLVNMGDDAGGYLVKISELEGCGIMKKINI